MAIRPDVERLHDPSGPYLHDPGVGVAGVGDDAALGPGKGFRGVAHLVERHGQQRHRDALPHRQQHIELPGRGGGDHLFCQREEPVGGVAHRADHHDDALVALFLGDDSLRDPLELIGVGHG